MDRKKGRNSWLVFLLPVLVSAAVMFACGAVFLTGESGPETFTFSSGSTRTPTSEEFEQAEHAAERGSPELDSSARRGPNRPFGARASQRERQPAEETSPNSEEEGVDWELEMADSEEVEPTPEMIEEERQKIREGKASFGFVGRPGARFAQALQARLEERRAERQEQNPGQATLSPNEDTEIHSENAVVEAGTAGAGPR